MTKRVFIAALGTETNQFVPFPTGRRAYEEHGVWRGDATKNEPTNFTAPMHVWRKETEKRGWTVIEGLATFAAPSGTTVRSVYEGFRDEILAGIEGGPAARCRADQRARRHGGRRLRRLRRRSSGQGARHRRAQGGDRRGVRSALPSQRPDARQRRRADRLQGISAHRHDGARRRAVRHHRRHGRGQGEAGDGAPRLPHDRAIPHLRAADQRVRHPHEVARGQGRHSVGVAEPRLLVRRCRGCRHTHARRRRRRQGQGRSAGQAARPGAVGQPRTLRHQVPVRLRGDGTRGLAQPGPAGAGRPRRQSGLGRAGRFDLRAAARWSSGRSARRCSA